VRSQQGFLAFPERAFTASLSRGSSRDTIVNGYQ
jgi:hypothetical protein